MTGNELKAWRQGQGWTLNQAARFLGTTKTSVHRWEAGTPDKRGVPRKVPGIIMILTHLLREQKNIRSVENLLYQPLDE